MKPTIGRIVIYKFTEQEQDGFRKMNNSWKGQVNIQTYAPGVIVAVWSDTCVNLRVLVDGSIDAIWKTSVLQGERDGCWEWPTQIVE